MKLHNILYLAGFLCLIIGTLGIDGWMYNGTSLAIPVLLIVSAIVLWYLGMKEDGRIRKRSSKKDLLQQVPEVRKQKTFHVFIMAWGKGKVK